MWNARMHAHQNRVDVVALSYADADARRRIKRADMSCVSVCRSAFSHAHAYNAHIEPLSPGRALAAVVQGHITGKWKCTAGRPASRDASSVVAHMCSRKCCCAAFIGAKRVIRSSTAATAASAAITQTRRDRE